MDKPFYKSRTVWAGLIILAYGVLTAVGVDLSNYTEVIITIASGLGVIGIRGALPTKK